MINLQWLNYVVSIPDNQDGYDNQEKNADKTIPSLEGHPAAGDTSGNIEQCHQYGNANDKISLPDENNQRRDISHAIDNLRIGRCLDKFKPQDQHKCQHEKTSGPGAKKAVIEPNY